MLAPILAGFVVAGLTSIRHGFHTGGLQEHRSKLQAQMFNSLPVSAATLPSLKTQQTQPSLTCTICLLLLLFCEELLAANVVLRHEILPLSSSAGTLSRGTHVATVCRARKAISCASVESVCSRSGTMLPTQYSGFKSATSATKSCKAGTCTGDCVH